MELGFSQRLAELRNKHGYSQEQLGKLLYVSRQAVSKWECGDAVPDIDNLTALAKLYNISLDELVGGTEVIKAEEHKARQTWINKPHKRLYAVVSVILILLPFVMLFIWLPFLPKVIPAHYNTAGQVDRWGSKFELLLIAAVNPLIAIITTAFVLSMRKRISAEDKNRLAFILFVVHAAVFVGFIVMAVVFAAKAMSLAGVNTNVNIYTVTSIACSSIVMLLGAVMPFTKPNAFFGIRTARTMSDSYLWKKIYILSGVCLFVVGVGLNIFNLLYSNSYINAIVFAVVMVVTVASITLLSSLFKSRNSSD